MDQEAYQTLICECSPMTTTSWNRSGKELEERLSAQEILSAKTIYNDKSKAFRGADVAVIYAEGDSVRKCLTCKTAFDKQFNVPQLWWTTLAKRSNGYFGYENVLDADKMTRSGTISWVRFIMKRVRKYLNHHNKDDIQYDWVKLNAFTRWYAPSKEHPKGRTEIVLFDHPDFAQKVGDSLISQINSRELGDPFWVYPIMAGEVAKFQDECVWGTRDLIRSYEKQRSLYRDLFVYLHEVSRHSIHINETLHVAESILDSMQKHHDQFISTESSHGEVKDHSDPFSQNIQNRLGHLHTTITHLRHRAESNHERVKTEISLSYNTFAQVDSSATKSISLVGLLFLPAAFVAAIFSTSFFNYDAPTGIWGLSDKFWIYWAVTIPVTVSTIFLWFVGPMIWGAVMYVWNDWQDKIALKKEKEKKEREKKEKELEREGEEEQRKINREKRRRMREEIQRLEEEEEEERRSKSKREEMQRLKREEKEKNERGDEKEKDERGDEKEKDGRGDEKEKSERGDVEVGGRGGRGEENEGRGGENEGRGGENEGREDEIGGREKGIKKGRKSRRRIFKGFL